MRRIVLLWLAVGCLTLSACGGDDEGGGGGGSASETKEITIGWTPPDITGVFKTATDYFERAAKDAKKAGFDVEIISRSPATHTAFADQLGDRRGLHLAQRRRDRDLAGRHRGDQAGDQAGQPGRHPGDHGQPARAAEGHRDRQLHRLRQRRGSQGLGLLGARLLRRPGRARRRREGGGQARRLPRPHVVGGDLRRRRQERDQGQGLDHRGHRRHVLLAGAPRRLQLGRRAVPGRRDRWASRSPPTGTARRASRRRRTSSRATSPPT